MNRNGFLVVPVIILVAIAIVAIGAVVYFYPRRSPSEQSPVTQSMLTSTTPITPATSSAPVAPSTITNASATTNNLQAPTTTVTSGNVASYALITWQQGSIELSILVATVDYDSHHTGIILDCPYGCPQSSFPALIHFQLEAKNNNKYATGSTSFALMGVDASGSPINSPIDTSPSEIVLGANATATTTVSFLESQGGTQFEFTTGTSSNIFFEVTAMTDSDTSLNMGTIALVPNCTFSADPSSIVPPQSVQLSWSCKNAKTCSITSDQGDSFPNQNSRQGTLSVKPTAVTNYKLSCGDANGFTSSSTASVQVVLPVIDQ